MILLRRIIHLKPSPFIPVTNNSCFRREVCSWGFRTQYTQILLEPQLQEHVCAQVCHLLPPRLQVFLGSHPGPALKHNTCTVSRSLSQIKPEIRSSSRISLKHLFLHASILCRILCFQYKLQFNSYFYYTLHTCVCTY